MRVFVSFWKLFVDIYTEIDMPIIANTMPIKARNSVNSIGSVSSVWGGVGG